MNERILQIAKLLHKCEALLNDIKAEMSRTSQRLRKRKKRKSLIGKIRDEVVNIISINAR